MLFTPIHTGGHSSPRLPTNHQFSRVLQGYLQEYLFKTRSSSNVPFFTRSHAGLGTSYDSTWLLIRVPVKEIMGYVGSSSALRSRWNWGARLADWRDCSRPGVAIPRESAIELCKDRCLKFLNISSKLRTVEA